MVAPGNVPPASSRQGPRSMEALEVEQLQALLNRLVSRDRSAPEVSAEPPVRTSACHGPGALWSPVHVPQDVALLLGSPTYRASAQPSARRRRSFLLGGTGGALRGRKSPLVFGSFADASAARGGRFVMRVTRAPGRDPALSAGR